jgi:6-phosphofructokinase 1
MDLHAVYARGKSHAITIVAEGAPHNADALAQYFHAHQTRLGFDFRVCRLGHVQRGGAPGVFDRMLATRLGAGAIDALVAGHDGVLLGSIGGQVTRTPLAEAVHRKKPLDPTLLELAHAMAQ